MTHSHTKHTNTHTQLPSRRVHITIENSVIFFWRVVRRLKWNIGVRVSGLIGKKWERINSYELRKVN
jgi:hypothetical protein